MKYKDYIVSIISKFSFSILAFINSIIINRFLGPAIKGEYSYVLNLMNILTLILGFNISSSLPYFYRKYGVQVRKTITNTVYKQFILYLILIGFVFLIFESSLVRFVFVFSVLIQFSNQIDFISLIMNINQRNKMLIFSNVFYTLSLLIVSVFFEPSVNIIFYCFLVFHILKTIIQIIKNKIKPSISISKKPYLKEILGFSIFSLLTEILTTLNYSVDTLMLKPEVDSVFLGYYSVGVTLSAMLWIIPDAFKEVLANRTAKNESVSQIVMSIKINIYICTLIIIGFFLLGKPFITIFYGIEYGDSYGVTQILIFGTIPMVLFKIINTFFLADGKQKYSSFILATSVVLNIIINMFAIPKYGIYGAAVSTFLSYLSCGMLMTATFCKAYNVKVSELFLINSKEISIIKEIFNK